MDEDIRDELIRSFCPDWPTGTCSLGENPDGSVKSPHDQLATWVTTAIRGDESVIYIVDSLADALKEAIYCHGNPDCDASQDLGLGAFLKKLYANIQKESTYREFKPFYEELKSDIAYMIPNKIPQFMLAEILTDCCGYQNN